MIYPEQDMKRWEYCNNVVTLANADYYYTKEQVDEKISGLTQTAIEEMVERKIREILQNT